jgi:hypothetical protein
MSVWYCENCQELRGPWEANTCPQCGRNMSVAYINQETDVYGAAFGDPADTWDENNMAKQKHPKTEDAPAPDPTITVPIVSNPPVPDTVPAPDVPTHRH